MNKLIFELVRAPGITQHSVVGYLIDREKMSLDKAINLIRNHEQLASDDKLFLYATDASIVIHDTNDEDNIHTDINFTSILTGPLTNYNSRWVLVTRSLLTSMYPVDLDGDTLNVTNVEEIVSGLPELQPYERSYTGRGAYNVRNKWLQSMKHHAFDRDQLTKLFNDYIASNDKAFETLEDAIAGTDDHEVGDFRCWKDSDEEFYILHVPSGTIVGWYKFYHFGRDNFTNRDMTIDDLKDFFVLLRNQLLDEPDEPDTPDPPKVRVTETDKSSLGRVEDWDETPSYPDAPKKKPYNMDIPAIMERLRRNSTYGMLSESIGGIDIASMYPHHPEESPIEDDDD